MPVVKEISPTDCSWIVPWCIPSDSPFSPFSERLVTPAETEAFALMHGVPLDDRKPHKHSEPQHVRGRSIRGWNTTIDLYQQALQSLIDDSQDYCSESVIPWSDGKPVVVYERKSTFDALHSPDTDPDRNPDWLDEWQTENVRRNAGSLAVAQRAFVRERDRQAEVLFGPYGKHPSPIRRLVRRAATRASIIGEAAAVALAGPVTLMTLDSDSDNHSDSNLYSQTPQQQTCQPGEQELHLGIHWRPNFPGKGACWDPDTRMLSYAPDDPNQAIIIDSNYCTGLDQTRAQCWHDLETDVQKQLRHPSALDGGATMLDGQTRQLIIPDTNGDGMITVEVKPDGDPFQIFVRTEDSPSHAPTATPLPEPTSTPDPLAAEAIPAFPKEPKPLAPDTAVLLNPIWESTKGLMTIKLLIDGLGLGILGLEGVGNYYFFDKVRRSDLNALVRQGKATKLQVDRYMAPLEREGNTRRLLWLTTGTAFSWISFVAATGVTYRAYGYAATPVEALAGYIVLIQLIDSMPVRWLASLPARVGFAQLLKAHEFVSSSLYALAACGLLTNFEYAVLPEQRFWFGALVTFTILRILNTLRRDPLNS
ncbi:hypothetical protein HY339_01325 [Candidatus Gottesmanbacteria bacterium]|nr:hypothetical protein [Candidatus Gottesmanbacteria bacterium]